MDLKTEKAVFLGKIDFIPNLSDVYSNCTAQSRNDIIVDFLLTTKGYSDQELDYFLYSELAEYIIDHF